MHSVGVIVSMLAGCALGSLILGRYPRGLDTAIGWYLIICAVLLALPMYLARENRALKWTCIFAVATLSSIGWALRSYPPVDPGTLAYYNGPENSPAVTVTGTVSAEPALSDKSQRVRIAVREVRLRGSNHALVVSGELLALLPRYPAYAVGDQIAVSGPLTDPPAVDGFDYRAYLARGGIHSYMLLPRAVKLGPGDAAPFAREMTWLRNKARSALKATIAEPIASLATGVVIGDRSSMPVTLQEAFLASGTVHVLAISGQNLSLLVGFIWVLYSRGRNRGRLPGWLAGAVIAGLVFYTAFTGATPSVVRASIMAAILLLGPVLGRRYDPVAALAVSAAVMTFWDPDILGDAGFQLSFGAMLGIALVAPRLEEPLASWRLRGRAVLPSVVSAAIATGIGAQVVTLPVSVALSGRVSLVSPLATMSIDVALLPLMIAGLTTVLLYAVAPPLAVGPATIAWLCGAWMAWWVQMWAALPGASITVPDPGLGWAVAYYALISGLILSLPRTAGLRGRRGGATRQPATAILLCCALWVAAAWLLLAG